jgi:hypothetical protein
VYPSAELSRFEVIDRWLCVPATNLVNLNNSKTLRKT